MRKFWLIFWYEYRRHVLTWRFAFNHFVLPLIFGLLMVFIVGVVLILGSNRDPVGYVDQAGLFASGSEGEYRLPGFIERYLGTTFLAYPVESEARAAMEQSKIQGYYVLPPDFRQTRAARLVYRKSPSLSARTRFESKIQSSLLAEIPAQTRSRLLNDSRTLNLTLSSNSPNSSKSSDSSSSSNSSISEPKERGSLAIVRYGFILLLSMLLFFVIMNCGGYLSKIIVDEKTNRTVEILITSVTPGELMLSKLSALLSVGLTEMLISSSLPGIALAVLAVAGLSITRILPFSLLTLGLILLLALLTFMLMATLIATFGAAIAEARDAENYMLLPMVQMGAFMLAVLVAEAQPHHPLLVALSFFPLTAFPVLAARMMFAVVPDWQPLVSTLLVGLACAGALWLIGRVFRASLLKFDTRLHLRTFVRLKLRSRLCVLTRERFQRSA